MKKQGILTLVSAIAIQLTLGIAYLWSLFQNGIAATIFSGNNAAAALTFSLLLSTLTIGSVIGGKLAVKYSTRLVVLIGGVILSAGFFLASRVNADFPWLIWLAYGVMGGVGMGFTYSTTIACAQKWYPHKKGLVTGVIVSALGFGGVIFTPVIEQLIKTFGGQGVGESNTFAVLAAIFLTVCTIGSLSLKNPPEDHMTNISASTGAATAAIKDYTPSEMLRTKQFYTLTAAFMLSCMGGLMMIAFAKPIAEAKGLGATAYIGVLALSMLNSFGRLFWGGVSDRIGRKQTIIVLLVGNAILSLLVTPAQGVWVFALVAMIGFFYGGLLSNFPTLTADIFGAKHMATNYGFVLLGFGTGAILSSQIAGYYKDVAEAAGNDIRLMFPAFVVASCCAVVAIVLMLTLKSLKEAK